MGRQPADQVAVWELQDLLYLDLRGHDCLPAELEALGQLKSLLVLDVSNCRQFGELPASFSHLTALQELHLCRWKQLTELPERIGDLTALRRLNLSRCSQLSELPATFGQLKALEVLDLSRCKQLTALPETLGQLSRLQLLDLSGCRQLLTLPESTGQLTALRSLDLSGCIALKALPDSCSELAGLQHLQLDGCSSLPQQLPGSDRNPQERIVQVLRVQLRYPAIIKLATQQETMLTTLERMSWLAVLLATATFVAFMQPPGATEEGQVLVSNNATCATVAAMRADAAISRQCWLLMFFCLDGLSFAFSFGCTMMIIVISMPRLQYGNNELEAGRFWLLLLVTWVLLYCAVLTGFGAFIASGLAVHNRWQVVVGPVAPGVLLFVVGFAVIIRRFATVFPGWSALGAALSRRKHVKYADTGLDIEMGQSLFWKHCKQVLDPGRHEAVAWPVAVLGGRLDDKESTRLLNTSSAGSSGLGATASVDE